MKITIIEATAEDIKASRSLGEELSITLRTAIAGLNDRCREVNDNDEEGDITL